MNIKKLFDYSVPMVAAATILVIGALIVAVYGGRVVSDIKRANDTIEVTGSAKEAVIADLGRWVINLETHTGVHDQQSGFDRLQVAVSKIETYLTETGFSEYETPAGNTYPTYTYPEYSEPILTGYTVVRSIVVRSPEIEKLAVLANNVKPFVGEGYNVATAMLELTYSKLSEMRVKLLRDAIKDATERAQSIAKDSGRTVGSLRNASSGVVQVLPEGGVDISDYGSYDTQSVHKEVMVTVRATFGLE